MTPAGLVRPGLESAGFIPAPGVVGSAPGAVSPAVPGIMPGLVMPGLVIPGLASPGVPSPGLVRPGLVRPVVPIPGLVRPGLVRPVVVPLLPLSAGTGGKLIPNCDSPCDSAPNSSPGRSVMTAACLNS